MLHFRGQKHPLFIYISFIRYYLVYLYVNIYIYIMYYILNIKYHIYHIPMKNKPYYKKPWNINIYDMLWILYCILNSLNHSSKYVTARHARSSVFTPQYPMSYILVLGSHTVRFTCAHCLYSNVSMSSFEVTGLQTKVLLIRGQFNKTFTIAIQKCTYRFSGWKHVDQSIKNFTKLTSVYTLFFHRVVKINFF